MAIPCCSNVEIPVVDLLTVDEFEQHYFGPGRPVIINGVIEQWPAKSWTLDKLQEKAGDAIVHVRINTDCAQYKLGQQYGIKQMPFSEYIEDIKRNKKRALNSYLAVQNIKKALPMLEDDIRLPPYVGKVHGGPFLWIANKGHYEYNHFDPDDGFLIILSGLKQVRLFSCESIDRLYPNALGTKGRTIQSQVDCDNPDLVAHPGFEGVTCHYGQIRDGQVLYIPAMWWHQITSLETTISINIFWGNSGPNNFITKVMEIPTWPCFRHWLLNIIEQNRLQPSFPRILSRIRESLPNFLMTQWHETLTEDQVDRLVRVILDHLGLKELPAFEDRDENQSEQTLDSREMKRANNPPPLKIRGLLWRD